MSDVSGDRPEAPAAPQPPSAVAKPGAVRALRVGALAAGLLAAATLVAPAISSVGDANAAHAGTRNDRAPGRTSVTAGRLPQTSPSQ